MLLPYSNGDNYDDYLRAYLIMILGTIIIRPKLRLPNDAIMCNWPSRQKGNSSIYKFSGYFSLFKRSGHTRALLHFTNVAAFILTFGIFLPFS